MELGKLIQIKVEVYVSTILRIILCLGSKDSGGLNGCNPMTWCGAPQDYGLPVSID